MICVSGNGCEGAVVCGCVIFELGIERDSLSDECVLCV